MYFHLTTQGATVAEPIVINVRTIALPVRGPKSD